jgi:hypothetical protein
MFNLSLVDKLKISIILLLFVSLSGCSTVKDSSKFDCDNLPPSEMGFEKLKDGCYLSKAKNNQDISVCYKLFSERDRRLCYSLVTEKQDPTKCSKIIISQDQMDFLTFADTTSFYDKYPDFWKDECISGVSYINKDPKICAAIKNNITKERCLIESALFSSDYSVCDDFAMGSPYKLLCYIYYAHAAKDISICDHGSFNEPQLKSCKENSQSNFKLPAENMLIDLYYGGSPYYNSFKAYSFMNQTYCGNNPESDECKFIQAIISRKMNYCTKINDTELKRDCIDEIYFVDDLKVCDLLENNTKLSCLLIVSIETNDLTLCESSYFQDGCNLIFAYLRDDPGLCGRNTIPLKKDPCYYSLALQKKDVSICKNIQGTGSFTAEGCVSEVDKRTR